jgi:hypothetical protein
LAQTRRYKVRNAIQVTDALRHYRVERDLPEWFAGPLLRGKPRRCAGTSVRHPPSPQNALLYPIE